MASPMLVKVACLAVMCMVLGTHLGDAALSCGQIQVLAVPCLGYLRNPGGGAVPGPCCNGVRTLNTQARTTPDRQAACRCLKTLIFPGINPATLAGLPGKCGVNLPFKISPSIDCNKVQ